VLLERSSFSHFFPCPDFSLPLQAPVHRCPLSWSLFLCPDLSPALWNKGSEDKDKGSSCKVCSCCELGIGQLQPRDGLCTLRQCVLLTLTICPSCCSSKPLADVARPRSVPQVRVPQYPSTHATHVTRHLVRDHASPNSPLLYIASLYSFVCPWLPFLFRLLPCM
jgi:hypothetical protein